MEITPRQIRAARALIRLEQAELAARAGVSVVTIRRVEAEDGRERVAETTVQGVRRALERAGVEFIQDGVRERRHGFAEGPSLFEDLRAISLRSAARTRHDPGQDVLTDADLYDEDGLPA